MRELAADRVIQLRGVGLWAPGGLYSAYSTDLGACETDGEDLRMSRAVLSHFVDQINTHIGLRWPCLPCYGFSVLCCPFTLGLSALLVRCMCYADAEDAARAVVEHINNKPACVDNGIEFSLVFHRCYDSWLEIRLGSAEGKQLGGGSRDIEGEQSEAKSLVC